MRGAGGAVIVVVATLAACGRVGFGPNSAVGDGGSGSAIDATTVEGQACGSDADCPMCSRCETNVCQAEPINELILGHRMTCYLGAGSSRWCAGENVAGDLGLGFESDSVSRPTRNVGEDGWTALYLGYEVSTGERAGDIWQVGGTTLPVDQAPIGNVVDVYYDGLSTCTLYTDRTLSCDQTDSLWAQFDEGYNFQCGVRTDGTLWCWGYSLTNDLAQVLPDGQLVADPAQVGTDTDWVEVGAGYAQACGRKLDGTIWCWGDAPLTGTNGVATNGVPTQINADTDWAWMQIRWNRACAGKASGEVWCWGADTDATAEIVPGSSSAPVPTLMGTFDQWRTGGHHECGLRGGQWACLGWNAGGQLGIGNTDAVTDFVPLCGP